MAHGVQVLGSAGLKCGCYCQMERAEVVGGVKMSFVDIRVFFFFKEQEKLGRASSGHSRQREGDE